MAFNILVVDDSRTIRSVLKKTLALAGLNLGEVYTAGDGKEALDCLRDNWVDVVISDLNMPVMTGVELIDEMSEDDLLKSIPVIVISTDGSATRIAELKAKGVRQYIRKPFTPETVGEIISAILGEVDERSKA
jgi:two-component system chemotaxis response regulator CheY